MDFRDRGYTLGNIEDKLKYLIGMSYAAATEDLSSKHMSHRIAQEDDNFMMLTCDYNPYRINLKIKNGLVVEFHMG